jgi:hypothetical protein
MNVATVAPFLAAALRRSAPQLPSTSMAETGGSGGVHRGGGRKARGSACTGPCLAKARFHRGGTLQIRERVSFTKGRMIVRGKARA